MEMSEDLKALQGLLSKLRQEGKVMLAYLYGSYASSLQHGRSDIDLALYLNVADNDEKEEITNEILMSSDRDIGILMLDDEDESPFIIQQALKGIPLIEPDLETLYNVSHRALHETESIRHKRMYASL